MQNFAIFQSIMDTIDNPFLASVSKLVAALLAYAQPVIEVLFILYMAITGIALMKGRGGSAGGFLSSVLRICAVYWLAFEAGNYTTYVQTLFMTTIPTEVANALSGASLGAGPVTASIFDVLWQRAFTAGLVVFRQLDVSVASALNGLVVILFLIAAIVATALAFVLYLVSHVVLGLYVIVGPLLIAALLFDATRRIFDNWISSLISCVLLQIGIVILLSLTIQVEQNMVMGIVGYLGPNIYVQIGMMMSGIGLFIVCAYIAFEMKDWANSLSAGMHSNAGMATLLAAGMITGKAVGAGRGLAERLGVVTPPAANTPPGASLSGGGQQQPWMAMTGGYAQLSPAHQQSAQKSYSQWAAANPKLGAKYGLHDYTAYVQKQQTTAPAPDLKAASSSQPSSGRPPESAFDESNPYPDMGDEE